MAPRGGTSTGEAALHAANSVLKKKADYEKGYKQIHASSLLLAERLTAGGDIEKALLMVADGNEGKTGKAEAWLAEQRSRLKALAEGNVRGMRDIESFVTAVSTVKDDIVESRRVRNERRLEDDEDGDDTKAKDEDEVPPDYERAVLDGIAEARSAAAPSQLDMVDEDMYREMRSRLGEKEPKKKRRGGADDDDEDLEVVDDGHGADAEASLKCPITGTLFENPVKNKVCGHVYSRAGFDHIIKSSHGRQGGRCPVAGCTNHGVRKDQVEDDVEMAMRVHRFRKRAEQEARVDDRLDRDDEDLVDEDEDEAAGGTTVIN